MATADFNVQIIKKSIVRAVNVSVDEPSVIAFSNFDLLSGRAPVSVFYAYPKPQLGDFSTVVSVIKSSLQEALSHYFPFAGRIVSNLKTGDPEILCNNEGVEVIEACTDIDLASLDFYHVDQSLQKNLVPLLHEIPMCLQLTSYSCGGFSVAWSFDHGLADAASFYMFVVSWSAIARNHEPISKYPDHRRSIFRPRSPPTYDSSIDRTFSKWTMEEVLNTPITLDISVKRLYFIEASDVVRLQEEASQDGHKRTKLEAFSAYLWKILAVAISETESKAKLISKSKFQTQKCCKMGWLVDGRRRMTHRNVSNLIGNAVSIAIGEASLQDLNQVPLSQIASIAHEAIGEVTNEAHFLDVIDWIECHKPGLFLANILLGIDGPAIIISSGRQFPSREVDLGFGPPVFGSSYSTIPRLGAGFVHPQPSTRGDGSWVVFVMVWPELAAALESDPNHVFRPLTATHLGLTS